MQFSNWPRLSSIRALGPLFNFSGMSFPHSHWQFSTPFAPRIPHKLHVSQGVLLTSPDSLILEPWDFIVFITIVSVLEGTQKEFKKYLIINLSYFFPIPRHLNGRARTSKFYHFILLIKVKVKTFGSFPTALS